ncbi:MAG: hypothetical protein ACRESE_09590 [Gammaproteobacteria bacterium]
MKFFGLLVMCSALLLTTTISGCASRLSIPPGAELVRQPAQRFDDAGFSIVPPPGDGWYGMRIGGMITFGKVFSPTHTFVVSIAIIRVKNQFANPQGFLGFVERGKSKDTNPQRFTVLASNFGLDPAVGPDCVHYHRKAEDHGAPEAKGKTLILDVLGIACLHPDDPHRAVDIEYSERSVSGNVTSSVYVEGQAFLSSLQFVSLKKSN